MPKTYWQCECGVRNTVFSEECWNCKEPNPEDKLPPPDSTKLAEFDNLVGDFDKKRE